MSSQRTSDPPLERQTFAPEFRLIDPLNDERFSELVAASEQSSFFHSAGWAKVLHDTYGHRPFYLGKVSGAGLTALFPIMEVSSRYTGCRGVSLPFTDRCPLVTTRSVAPESLYEAALQLGRERKWQHLEWRDNQLRPGQAQPYIQFHSHTVELAATALAKLGSAMRRGIRKAQESSLRITFNNTSESMRTFYRLHCGTRRRHGVPPQPFAFFENILRHVIQSGNGFIATAWASEQAIAAAVFFKNRRQAIYKFGASDFKFQQLRPNNLLMWEAIKHCAELGCESLYLGRSSLGQEGLRRFKLSFGAIEELLNYYRYDFRRDRFVTGVDRASSRLTTVFKCLPPPLFRLAGQILYPHLS